MKILTLLFCLLTYVSLAQIEGSRPHSNSLVATSTIAFTVTEKDAHIESIAYDSKQKTFFLGAIHKHKILQLTPKGQYSDFSSEGKDELYSVLGLRADSKRRTLWACATALPQMQGFTEKEQGKAAVYRYDLDRKKLLQRYYLKKDGHSHVLGEPLVASNGDVYISDSGYPAIYRIRLGSDSLELFLLTRLRSLQGIAFSADESVLFIADYSSGIHRYTMKTGELLKLVRPETIDMRGTDGLYFYQNKLIAIQNGISPNRVVRFGLDETLTQITDVTILEIGNPIFNEPTTGVIVGSQLFYIANSQWSHYNKDNSIFPMEKLDNTLILRTSLE